MEKKIRKRRKGAIKNSIDSKKGYRRRSACLNWLFGPYINIDGILFYST
jgi:hypothetical protein